MAKRLRVNVIFSFLNALVTLLFPLITYPYVSRVLAPEGIGAYNIAYSIMSYFMLFANLGIPIYGIRAIAKVMNDQVEQKKIATNVMLIHAISTAVVFAMYMIYVCFASNAQSRFWVNFITGFQIIGMFLNVEWYYQGREEYRAITIKNFTIKVISLVLIFVFVKGVNDVVNYALIMIFSVLGYGIFNFIHFIVKVKPRFKYLNLKAIFKPVLLCFALYAASRLANGLDVIMIDVLLGDKAEYVAGQYGVATKFVNVIIDLLLVVNTVMLPRLSMLIEQKETEGAKALSTTICDFMFMFVVPATIGLIFISEDIVSVFFGSMYQPAVTTMMVMSANAFLAVFTNFLGVSIIYAYGKDWFTTIAILIGAAVNIGCNFILIPKYLQLGAAIATIISNSIIFIIELVGTLKWKYIRILTIPNLKTIFASIVLTACLLLTHFYLHVESYVWKLIIKVIVGIVAYALVALLSRHESIMFFIKEIKSKIRAKNAKIQPVCTFNEGELSYDVAESSMTEVREETNDNSCQFDSTDTQKDKYIPNNTNDSIDN